MNQDFPEEDWKYLRKIEPDMLNALCLRIHKRVESIIIAPDKTEHEKYLELYQCIQDSDDIVALCFNDWRRSTIEMKLRHLLRHDLLEREHVQNLSNETQALVGRIRADLPRKA